jgi:hypothetical protein
MAQGTLKTLELTNKQRYVLMLLLSIDLDALGLEKKDQATARAIRAKLVQLGD